MSALRYKRLPTRLYSRGLRLESCKTAKRSLTTSSGTSQRRPTRVTSIGIGSVCVACLAVANYSVGPWFKRSPIRNDSPGQLPSKAAILLKKRDPQTLNATSAKEDELAKSEQRQNATPPQPGSVPISEAKAEEGDEETAWLGFTKSVSNSVATLSNIKWASIPDAVTAFILPNWALTMPEYISKLQRELSTDEGSLAREIWDEAQDTDLNPEIEWQARVRVSSELSKEEKDYLRRRKRVTRAALAKYLDIPESEIHPDDVPTIAMVGSGGGLRALIAWAGSIQSAAEDGLYQCTTYTAGVSGSCWALTLLNSTIAGPGMSNLIGHLKARLGTHIAYPPTALQLLSMAPTNKYLLKGVVEKIRADPKADWGLVDIYGTLLASRLLVPKGELDVKDFDLKVSNQRKYLSAGQNPLPIYTAVRHEIPLEEVAEQRGEHKELIKEETKEKAKQEAWFQWFEWTPYELFCEEIGAGIPSWAVGRKFNDGRDLPAEHGLRAPELKIPVLLGMWGSAFCATLSHYYKELRPILQGLTGFASLDKLVEERNDDLIKVHPFDPAGIPNFAVGMKGKLPPSCPRSIYEAKYLQLMDAGLSNNLPLYPLLRPGRDCDIILAFDNSTDIHTANWLSLVDGYARQRGILGWPLGAGWPKEGVPTTELVKDLEDNEAQNPQETASKVDAARKDMENGASDSASKTGETKTEITKRILGYCAVWVGSKEERTDDQEPPKSKVDDDEDWKLMKPNAGITVIYYPLIPNEKVPNVDPDTTDFMSTWNFIYTPEQVDKVVDLAKANFEESKDKTRRTIRAVYERKKQQRLERERLSGHLGR